MLRSGGGTDCLIRDNRMPPPPFQRNPGPGEGLVSDGSRNHVVVLNHQVDDVSFRIVVVVFHPIGLCLGCRSRRSFESSGAPDESRRSSPLSGGRFLLEAVPQFGATGFEPGSGSRRHTVQNGGHASPVPGPADPT